MTVPSFALVTLFSNPFLSRHKQITYTALFNKVFVLKEFYKKKLSYGINDGKQIQKLVLLLLIIFIEINLITFKFDFT